MREDAISRDAALDACSQSINILDAMSRIEDLLPVTPKQRTGHWIRVTDKAGHLVWECDKCGWQQRFNTNFCPNCGAKMEEQE